MKEYQELIGKIILAAGIVMAAYLLAGAINNGCANILSGLTSAGSLIRDGLLQFGSAT